MLDLVLGLTPCGIGQRSLSPPSWYEFKEFDFLLGLTVGIIGLYSLSSLS